MISKKKVNELLDQMEALFPDASCELNYENEFELVVAVLLSAQTTDKSVNKLTEKLFKKYKTPEDFDAASLSELEQDIKTIGLYRNKAKSIKLLARQLIENHGSKVPQTFEELVELGGVGRKTANVVLSVGFDVPAIAVDTHVERVSKRLCMCPQKDSVLEVEKKLMHLIPKERWSKAHHVFIHFGRYHCTAKNPKCEQCPLQAECKTGKKQSKA